MRLTGPEGEPGRFTVSAVIPLFNKQQAIRATLQSVFRQTRLPDELIVVDDGSTDASAAVADEALRSAPAGLACKLIRQENGGTSAARNRGAAESRSAYIAFLDADDEWLPDYLAEVEALATAYPEAAVVTTRNARTGANGSPVPEPSILPEGFSGLIEEPLRTYRKGYGIIHSSSVTIRRDAWARSGGFATGASAGEDVLLWLKLFMHEKVAHSSRPLSIFHQEHSTLARRKGLMPQYFSYFLGTTEGRGKLRDRQLAAFLVRNIVWQILERRSIGDRQIVSEILGLSRALPPHGRLLCRIAGMVPLALIRRHKARKA